MGLFGFGDSRAMGPVDTIIGEDVYVRGNCTTKHSIRVDGEVIGNVATEDGVIVARKGLVRGNISGKSILIGGRVKGNVIASQRLELQSTAQVEGNLSAPNLIIEEGAVFEGNCQMEDAAKVVDIQKARES